MFRAVDNNGVPRSSVLDAADVTYQTARGYLDEFIAAGLVDEEDAEYNPACSYTRTGWDVRQEFDTYEEAVADLRDSSQDAYAWMEEAEDATDAATTILHRLDQDRITILDAVADDGATYDDITGQVDADNVDYLCRTLADIGLIGVSTDRSDRFRYTATGRDVHDLVIDIGPDQAVDAFDTLRVDGRYDMLTRIDSIDSLSDLQDAGIDKSSGALTQWKDALVDAGLVEQEGYGRGASYYRTPVGGTITRTFDDLDLAPAPVARTLQSRTRLDLFGVADGMTASEAAEVQDLSYQSAVTYLREMAEEDLLFRESRNEQRYESRPALASPTVTFLNAVSDSSGMHSLVEGLVVTEEREDRGPVFVGEAAEEEEPQERTKDEMYSGYDGGIGN